MFFCRMPPCHIRICWARRWYSFCTGIFYCRFLSFYILFDWLLFLSGHLYDTTRHRRRTICMYPWGRFTICIKKDCVLESYRLYYPACRGVAQPGRVLAWGARGRRFDSCHPDQKFNRPSADFIFGLWVRKRTCDRRFVCGVGENK